MEPLASTYSDDDLLSLIEWHTVDFYVGLISTFICLPTLITFMSSWTFLLSNKLLALLAVGDFAACGGVLLVGIMRKNMYVAALETGRVPIENTWSCAVKPFVVLRLFGTIIPPPIVLWVGVERFMAVFTPVFYKLRMAKLMFIPIFSPNLPFLLMVLYVTIAMAVAYFLAYIRSDVSAPFYCGRKVAFGKVYSTFMYITDVFGFTTALILNCTTLGWLARLYRTKKRNRCEVNRQLRRMRYIIVISAVSTVMVAIPNAVSLSSAWLTKLDISLSEPSVWMLCFKSSINFFVYMCLKGDFRQRVYELFGCISVDDEHTMAALDGGVANNGGPISKRRVFDVSLPPSLLVEPLSSTVLKSLPGSPVIYSAGPVLAPLRCLPITSSLALERIKPKVENNTTSDVMTALSKVIAGRVPNGVSVAAIGSTGSLNKQPGESDVVVIHQRLPTNIINVEALEDKWRKRRRLSTSELGRGT